MDVSDPSTWGGIDEDTFLSMIRARKAKEDAEAASNSKRNVHTLGRLSADLKDAKFIWSIRSAFLSLLCITSSLRHDWSPMRAKKL